MRFQCQVADLMSGLSIVNRALAVRSTMQILEGVLLETCEKGLRLVCTDLALGIETVVSAEISQEGRVVLPGRLFSEIIRKLPGGNMEVTINENHAAVIRCQKSRTTLAGFGAEEFPDLPQVEDGNLISISSGLLRGMIQKTCFAIATDESRPLLTGCLLEIEENEIRLVALDGFRLALRKLNHSQEIQPMQAVIPGKVLGELAKVIPDEENDVSLNIGRTHLSADMGVTRVVTRLLEGEYTRYRRILPSEWQTRVKVKRAELSDAIEHGVMKAGITEIRTHSPKAIGREIQKAFNEGGITTQIKNKALWLFELFGTANEAVEVAPKLYEYYHLVGKGMPKMEAAMRAREGNLDFARAGSVGRELNRATAFFNANVQGVDKAVRTLTESAPCRQWER